MPAKKQAQLQEEVSTDEDWKNLVTSKKGLLVLDVYSEWCGPCKAVHGLFRRLKNELGAELLTFVAAKADTLSSFEKYRGRSQPCFLFMATGGILVAVVRGANGPLLEHTIKEQLEREKKILEGNGERVEIEDELPEEELLEDEVKEEKTEEEEVPVPTRKQYTIAIIKPDAVEAGVVGDVLTKVEAAGLEVLCKEERTMTREEAAEFYKQHEGSEHFEELVEFMTSGPCMTLVISKGDTGEGAVESFRDLLGPTLVEEAKEQNPESLRSQFGTGSWKNALHGSDSAENAARELAFFFPKYSVPWVPGTEPPIQRTLAIIRPTAFETHKDEIVEKIKESGFEIAMTKELELTKEEAEEFYKTHQEEDFFDALTTHMSSGPFLVLALAREDAVDEWRKALGPKVVEEAKEKEPGSLRAQYSVEDAPLNQLHGSETVEDADRELQFFFPPEQTVAVIKPNALSEKDQIISKIEEAGFTVSMNKETHLSKEQAEQLYSEHKDKDFFDDLTTFMSSGPSLFMVLTKHEAITGWRALMGPVDPLEAKEQDPNCIRALFGVDKIQNAVHGSSAKEKADNLIKEMFDKQEDEEDEEDEEEK